MEEVTDAKNGGPIFKDAQDPYYQSLSDVSIFDTEFGPVYDPSIKSIKMLPVQYRLPLTMLESTLNQWGSQETATTDLGIDPQIILNAIKPENLVNATEQYGLLYQADPCLVIPINSAQTIYIPGNFHLETYPGQLEEFGIEEEFGVYRRTLNTTFLLSGAGQSDQIFILESNSDGEVNSYSPADLYNLVDPEIIKYFGWNEQIAEETSRIWSRDTGDPVKNERRLEKFIKVAQKHLEKALILSPEHANYIDNVLHNGRNVTMRLIHDMLERDPSELRTVDIRMLGVKGKSVTIEDPLHEMPMMLTILDRVDVDRVSGEYGDISYYMIYTDPADHEAGTPARDQMVKVTIRYDKRSGGSEVIMHDMGDVKNLPTDPWSYTGNLIETEGNLESEYRVIDAADWAQHIIDRLPQEDEAVAIQAMALKPNDPGIEDLVEALIKKKETDHDVEITIAISKSSVGSNEDAKVFNRMFKAGIKIKWTDEASEHPYHGFNHRKLAAFGKKNGYEVIWGGTNLEGDSLLFLDWMVSMRNNKVFRDIVYQLIVNESGPSEAVEREFELFDVTPGEASYVATDSKHDLELFIEEAMKREKIGFIAENAYKDKESAIIDAAIMAINRAEKHIVIMGQWLPDGRVKEALLAALVRNPDIQIEIISNSGRAHMNNAIPHRGPRDKIVYGGGWYLSNWWFTRSIARLYKKGFDHINGRLKIFSTEKKLVHAKVVIVDGKLMIIGSDNFIESGERYRTREDAGIVSSRSMIRKVENRIENAKRSRWLNWHIR